MTSLKNSVLSKRVILKLVYRFTINFSQVETMLYLVVDKRLVKKKQKRLKLRCAYLQSVQTKSSLSACAIFKLQLYISLSLSL